MLAEIAQALGPELQSSGYVKRCVLLGLSGIGKSSLAAAYIAEYLQNYDVVFWIDAPDEVTTVNAFRTVGDTLGLDPVQLAATSDEHLAVLVQRTLGARVGRWLVVLDNVGGPDLMHRWMPQFGNGDVLVTSTSSGVPWRGVRVLHVGTMSVDQATDLLRLRLGIDGDSESDELTLLADELAAWPLALELAAGYLVSCGMGTDDIPSYLESLKLRSLDDKVAVPVGYPRTLVAAMDLSVDVMRRSTEDDDLCNVALEMLIAFAYLAELRAPVCLLIAAVCATPEELPTDRLGPVIPSGDDIPIPELVRLLTSASLTRSDAPTPPSTPDLPFANLTVSTNKVIQEVIRSRADDTPGRPRALEMLSFHLERWMTSAADKGEYDRLAVVEPHASALAGHLLALQVSDNSSALLLGNLSKLYADQNNHAAARSLLDAELEILARTSKPNGFVREQAALQRGINGLVDQGSTPRELDRSLSLIEGALTFVSRLVAGAADDENPAATEWHAASMAVYACTALDAFALEDSAAQRAGDLRTAFGAVLDVVPSASPSRGYKALLAASAAISADNAMAAERMCRGALELKDLPIELTSELRRMLVESLAWQRKWPEVSSELGTIQVSLGKQPPKVSWAALVMQNVGLVCASSWVAERDLDAIAPLRWVITVSDKVSDSLESYARQKLTLLKLTLAIADENQRTTAELLGSLLNQPQFDLDAPTDQGWRLLLSMAAVRARDVGVVVTSDPPVL
jgi:hypothetical protein